MGRGMIMYFKVSERYKGSNTVLSRWCSGWISWVYNFWQCELDVIMTRKVEVHGAARRSRNADMDKHRELYE
jgi:hypothetical protein